MLNCGDEMNEHSVRPGSSGQTDEEMRHDLLQDGTEIRSVLMVLEERD